MPNFYIRNLIARESRARSMQNEVSHQRADAFASQVFLVSQFPYVWSEQNIPRDLESGQKCVGCRQ